MASGRRYILSWKIVRIWMTLAFLTKGHSCRIMSPLSNSKPRCTVAVKVIVRIRLKLLTHPLKYKWPPLWTNRKTGWGDEVGEAATQLSGFFLGELKKNLCLYSWQIVLTVWNAWEGRGRGLPWQTRSTIITIWWKSFHEGGLHR